jgi:hypothetical protein
VHATPFAVITVAGQAAGLAPELEPPLLVVVVVVVPPAVPVPVVPVPELLLPVPPSSVLDELDEPPPQPVPTRAVSRKVVATLLTANRTPFFFVAMALSSKPSRDQTAVRVSGRLRSRRQ